MEDISKVGYYGVEEKNIQGKVNNGNECEEAREKLQAFQPVLSGLRRVEERVRERGQQEGSAGVGSDTTVA